METAEVSERRPVRYWVGRAVLTALGWREEGVVPDLDKYVLIAGCRADLGMAVCCAPSG